MSFLMISWYSIVLISNFLTSSLFLKTYKQHYNKPLNFRIQFYVFRINTLKCNYWVKKNYIDYFFKAAYFKSQINVINYFVCIHHKYFCMHWECNVVRGLKTWWITLDRTFSFLDRMLVFLVLSLCFIGRECLLCLTSSILKFQMVTACKAE